MHLTHLEFENFKSFTGLHEIDFSKKSPGVHFLCGDNQKEPDLEGNGCGKSSVWDAVFWCLYGKTLRSLKAGNVRNWQTDGGCFVSLSFEIDETPYTIFREWNPNKLLLQEGDEVERVVDQSEIDALIKLNPEEFQNSIIIGQFTDMFFDLRPAPKMQMFSEILDLGYWEELSGHAKADLSSLEGQKSGLVERQGSITSRINTLHEQLDSESEKSNDFEDVRKKDISKFKKDKKKIDISISKKEISLKKLGTTKLKAELTKAEKDLPDLEMELEEAADELQALGVKKGATKARIEDINESIEDLSGTSGVCHICKQKVTKAHIDKEIKKLKGKKSSLKKEGVDIETEMTEWNEEIDDRRKEIKTIKTDAGDIQKEIDNKISDARTLQRAIDNLQHQFDTLDDRGDQRKLEKNPHNATCDEIEDKIEAAQEKLDSVNNQIAALEALIESSSFWVKGFKEIRLMLIDEALSSLEIEVNNNLMQLGLKDWAIQFDVERETASGGISKGFVVYVESPHNDELVPWESWSGGEAQRLRLAGTMGLANLIRSRKGVTSNIEVYDEPTQHLSETGVEQLVQLFSERAIDENLQIWLVDHRSLDFGGFASITTVVKDDEGSHLT